MRLCPLFGSTHPYSTAVSDCSSKPTSQQTLPSPFLSSSSTSSASSASSSFAVSFEVLVDSHRWHSSSDPLTLEVVLTWSSNFYVTLRLYAFVLAISFVIFLQTKGQCYRNDIGKFRVAFNVSRERGKCKQVVLFFCVTTL